MNTTALVSRADASNLPQWADKNTYTYEQQPSTRNPHAARLLSTLRRYWWLLLLIWLAIAAPITFAVYHNMQAHYVATGAIRVSPTQNSSPLARENAQTPFYMEFLRTQAEFIKSSRVLQRAADDPRLAAYAWFNALPDKLDYLITNVNVQQVASSQLITVTMSHPNANAATDIVNAVIDAYTRLNAEDEENNVDKSLAILRQSRAATEQFIKDSQAKIQERTASGTTLSAEDDRKMLSELIGNSREMLARLEGEALSLRANLESLKNRPAPNEANFKESIAIETDEQIQRWTAEKMRVQLADNVLESKKATPQHPDRVEFRKQMKVLDQKITQRKNEMLEAHWKQYQAQIAVERERREHELQGDLKSAQDRIAALKEQLAAQDKEARTLSSNLQPIVSLREQLVDAKEALKRYNDRIAELESQNLVPGRVSLAWSAAVPQTPKVDRRPKIAAIANGGGLFLGCLTLIMLSRFRNRIECSEDLPQTIQPLVVGTVSNAPASARGLNGRVKRHILGEEMRLVHANLLPPGKPQRRIMMVTSPTPANGKTSIASHLAMSLAKSGLEVLLIDADLRKRDLTDMFDIGFRPGLAELLQGQTPELVRPVELLPNFRVMGAGGKLDRNPVELLQRQHFRAALDQLAEKADCIIVDTPPALVVADARLIAASCDEVLCVVRAQVSSSRDVDETIGALVRITGEAPKIIVNGVDQRHEYYKYKSSYAQPQAHVSEPAHAAPLGDVTG